MDYRNKITKLFDSPYLLLTFAVLFWSGNFIIGRAIRADMPPVALAFFRWSIACLIAIILAKPHLKNDLPIITKNIPILLFLAITGITAFNTLVYIGLNYTIAVNGLLFQSMIPVIIVALSFVLFKERLKKIQFIGILVSLSGVLAIISKGDLNLLLNLNFNKGDILVFLAVVCYGLYSVALRKRPSIHPMSFLAVTFTLGLLCLLPFYLAELIYQRDVVVNGRTLLAIAYVGIFPSIVSYLCYNRGVELVGPSKAGMFIHLMPVFGTIMAIVFLAESIAIFHVVGIVAIGAGIYLTTKCGK